MANPTRRSLLIGMSTTLMAAPAFSLGPHESASAMGTAGGSLVFVGGYTDKGSKSLGIYGFRWEAAKGELAALGLAAATQNPSFLAIAPNRRTLYAVNEVNQYDGAKDGSVSAFTLDRHTGKLQAGNVVSSGGSGPCNINLDHTGASVYVANYDGGTASSFTVQGNVLSHAVDTERYSGHGPDADRQAMPHAHCATVSPDNRWLLVNDLGLDKIHIYHLDAATAKLKANAPAAYEAIPRSGPRSFAFHPDGRFAYSTNELSNTVDVLHWNTGQGTLTRVQNITSLPAGFSGKNTLASVNVDAAGKFVYVSNRGDENSIVVYAVEPASGKLTHVQSIDSGGKTPRHFAIDPSGKWIVVAHQDSHTLVIFARDAATGRLTATGRSYAIDWPTCVLFA